MALPRSLSPFSFVYFIYICFILSCYLTFFGAFVVVVSSFNATSSQATPHSSILLCSQSDKLFSCGSTVNTEKNAFLMFFPSSGEIICTFGHSCKRTRDLYSQLQTCFGLVFVCFLLSVCPVCLLTFTLGCA